MMKTAIWKGPESVLPNIGLAVMGKPIEGEATLIDSYVEQGLAEEAGKSNRKSKSEVKEDE